MFSQNFCKNIYNGADEGNRTLAAGLGSRSSTIEPHPHVALFPMGLVYYT